MGFLERPETQSDRTSAKIKHILHTTSTQYKQLFNSWKRGMELVWKDPNPQDVIDKLHESLLPMNSTVSHLFRASAATASFLENLESGCTAQTMSLVKPFTVNQDGSITIDPE